MRGVSLQWYESYYTLRNFLFLSFFQTSGIIEPKYPKQNDREWKVPRGVSVILLVVFFWLIFPVKAFQFWTHITSQVLYCGHRKSEWELRVAVSRCRRKQSKERCHGERGLHCAVLLQKSEVDVRGEAITNSTSRVGRICKESVVQATSSPSGSETLCVKIEGGVL